MDPKVPTAMPAELGRHALLDALESVQLAACRTFKTEASGGPIQGRTMEGRVIRPQSDNRTCTDVSNLQCPRISVLDRGLIKSGTQDVDVLFKVLELWRASTFSASRQA